MKIREFFHENFEEQVVILLNCPKSRKVTCNVPPVMGELQVGYVGKNELKRLRMDKIETIMCKEIKNDKPGLKTD